MVDRYAAIRDLYDPVAERAVIGAMLLDATTAERVAKLVSIDAFSVMEHRVLFPVLTELPESIGEKPIVKSLQDLLSKPLTTQDLRVAKAVEKTGLAECTVRPIADDAYTAQVPLREVKRLSELFLKRQAIQQIDYLRYVLVKEDVGWTEDLRSGMLALRPTLRNLVNTRESGLDGFAR